MTLPKNWRARCGRALSTFWVQRHTRREPVCLVCRGGGVSTRRDVFPQFGDLVEGQFHGEPVSGSQWSDPSPKREVS